MGVLDHASVDFNIMVLCNSSHHTQTFTLTSVREIVMCKISLKGSSYVDNRNKIINDYSTNTTTIQLPEINEMFEESLHGEILPDAKEYYSETMHRYFKALKHKLGFY